MADQKKKVIIEVDLLDNTEKALRKLEGGFNSVKSVGSFALAAIKTAVVGATVAIGATIVAVETLGKRAGQMEGLALGFRRNFGNMEESLNSFRKASQGMVSDFDLMQTANRAALLGVTSNVEELAGLMVTARLRGREMGMDMTQAFNDIVTGIGRGSPLILDNLGIKIPDALTEAMEKMDETEKMQTLLNFAIKDGAKISAEYGGVTLTTAERVAIMNAQFVNFKDKFAGAISPLLGFVAMGLTPLGEALGKVSEALGKFVDGLGIDFEERVNAGIGFIHEWWIENEERFLPSLGRVTTKLVGQDSLRDAIISLFNPTDQEKEKIKSLLTEGLEKFLDNLSREGGLIDQVKNFTEQIAAFDTQNMKLAVETAIELMNDLLIITDKVITAFAIIQSAPTLISAAAGNVESQALTVKNTGVTKGTTAQDMVNSTKISIPTNNLTPVGADKYFKNATGGITSGGWTMVGERGAELVQLPRGSHVYNSEDTKQMSGGGGITINVNAPVTGVDNLRATILEAVNEATARQNRLANYNLL